MNTKFKEKNNMKYVYMVQLDWSTSDTDGLETELFENYHDAYACFKKRISDELNPEMSWVGEVFDKNGKVQEDYEFEKSGRPSQQTGMSRKVCKLLRIKLSFHTFALCFES